MQTTIRTSIAILAAALLCGHPRPATAQAVDFGRGALPVHAPTSFEASAPRPLVILLHGYGSDGARHDRYMNFRTWVDEYGFFLVSPDGTEAETERKPRFWNASAACCNFAGSTVDDSGYILGIIDDMKARYPIDADRVFLIGHSNGGFMSFRVAREHSEEIAAIVSLAGAAASRDLPAPNSPVHILQIHGTRDETILFEGGELGGTAYPGAVETVTRWAAYNGCRAEGTVMDEALDLDDAVDGAETVVTRFDGDCRPGGSAELWTIQDGAHSPDLSERFAPEVLEWLFAHPKR